MGWNAFWAVLGGFQLMPSPTEMVWGHAEDSDLRVFCKKLFTESGSNVSGIQFSATPWWCRFIPERCYPPSITILRYLEFAVAIKLLWWNQSGLSWAFECGAMSFTQRNWEQQSKVGRLFSKPICFGPAGPAGLGYGGCPVPPPLPPPPPNNHPVSPAKAWKHSLTRQCCGHNMFCCFATVGVPWST